MIIVTGGAGFIGSNIVHSLNKDNIHNIVIVDNLRNMLKLPNISSLKISDYIDKKDFIENIIPYSKLKNIKTVFHQGASSSTIEENGKYIMKNNYEYSKILLQYCLKYEIPFIYASSASVYGNQKNTFIEKKKYEIPVNIYGYSKALFDQYIRNILPKSKSQICGLRYFNVYGPNENHKGMMASMAFHIHQALKNNKNPKLFFGSEKLKRDFICVDDIVKINMWCWKNNISGIFNCGTGISESFVTLAKIIIAYNKKGDIEYIPFPKKLKKQYQKYTIANLTNLRIAGYTTSFKNIFDGVPEYMEYLNFKK